VFLLPPRRYLEITALILSPWLAVRKGASSGPGSVTGGHRDHVSRRLGTRHVRAHQPSCSGRLARFRPFLGRKEGCLPHDGYFRTRRFYQRVRLPTMHPQEDRPPSRQSNLLHGWPRCKPAQRIIRLRRVLSLSYTDRSGRRRRVPSVLTIAVALFFDFRN
jgi:hypothetical protein